MKTDGDLFGILLILMAAILVGLMPAFAKFAYAEGANVLMLLLARSAIGVIILVVFILLTGRTPGLTLAGMKQSFVPGLTHVFAAIGLLGSIVYIDISLANIILFLYPFPIAIVAHWRGEARLTPLTIAFMVLAMVGLALVLGVDIRRTDARGIGIAVMGMFSFSWMILSMADLTRAVGAPYSNLLMTLWAMLIFAVIAVVGPLTGLVAAPLLPETPFGWIAVIVVGVTFALAYLCFFVSANIIGATRASMLSVSEPVMIILFAVLLVGEAVSAAQWLGIAIVILSLTLTEGARRKQPNQES
jgi:drug/metabolite transporter (DMT)-like permease